MIEKDGQEASHGRIEKWVGSVKLIIMMKMIRFRFYIIKTKNALIMIIRAQHVHDENGKGA